MKKYTTLAVILLASLGAMAAMPQTDKKTKIQQVSAQDSVQHVTDSLKAIIKKADAGDADAQNTVGSWYYSGLNNCKQDFKTALQYWARSAKQGNAMAIGNMAICYQTGHGTDKDSTMAVSLFDKSIEKGNKAIMAEHEKESTKGNCFSSMYCAHCYEKGVGVKKDAAKAANYYVAAARQGSVEAMRLGGMALLNGNNATEAVKLFEKGAAHNEVTCMYWYGKLLLDGKGVKQDKEKAFIQLMKTAEKNFPMAMYQVGVCYQNGWGAEKDAKMAAQYFSKAAVRNLDLGKWAYAMALVNGEGVEQDYEAALYWFSRTVSDGYSKQFRKYCTETEDENWTKTDFMTYLQGMKAYSEGKIAEATKTFKSIEKKVKEAPLMLALCQMSPKNEKASDKKGMKMLEKVAETNPRANYYLAKAYEKGNSAVEKDAEKAMTLMNMAADARYYLAQCYLGDMYYEAKGVAKDYSAATKNYIAAFNQGMITSASAKRLATCYENAWGVEKNTSNAEYIRSIDTEDRTVELYKLF